MTEYELQQIRALRSIGESFERIAKQMEIRNRIELLALEMSSTDTPLTREETQDRVRDIQTDL